METVDIKLDEQNELEFKLEIESTEQTLSPPKARMVCECKGVFYAFEGKITGDGDIKVSIPVMEGRLPSGKYTTELEVFIENKYFVPLKFESNFKKSVKIVAEIKSKVAKKKNMVKATIVPTKTKLVVKEDKSREQLREKARQRKLLEAKKRNAEKKKFEETKLLEGRKKEAIKKRKLADRKRKLLEQKKLAAKQKSKDPDKELRDLLGDLGIMDDE
jgi:hypothetical protein